MSLCFEAHGENYSGNAQYNVIPSHRQGLLSQTRLFPDKLLANHYYMSKGDRVF